MLRAATPASVRPARSPTRGSVVDAAVAIGGGDTGRTSAEPPDMDDAHDTVDDRPAASASGHALRTLFISTYSR
jgi:hypothetical protein